MSRDDGFAVMDVSTDLVNDPKVRKLYRHAPDHANVAVVAYIATMAESWKAGRRVSIDDAWPAFVPFNKAAVAALLHVGLLDGRGLVTTKAWRGWFDPARTRRDASREKWRRANDRRKGKEEAIESHGSTCGLCQEPIDLKLRYPQPMSFTVDHIIPLSLGGADIPENRQPAHLECNLIKGNRGGNRGGNPGDRTVPSVPPEPATRDLRPLDGGRLNALVQPLGRGR